MALPRNANITDLDDFTESINMMIYGDSGIGKTVLSGSAENCLILATEKGVISAKRQGSTAKVWVCESWSDIDEAYKWLKDNPTHGFDWVAIDSLTEFQQLMLRWILDRAVSENSNRDPDIPAIQDHQKWQNMFKRYVRQFNALPVNMIYTATAFRKSDQEGDDLILPNLLGKDYEISQWVCASMHVVGYLAEVKLKDGSEIRRLRTRKRGPYFAKDRYDVLVPYVDNPTMPEIDRRIANNPPKGLLEARAKARAAADAKPVKLPARKAAPKPAKAAGGTGSVTPIKAAGRRAPTARAPRRAPQKAGSK